MSTVNLIYGSVYGSAQYVATQLHATLVSKGHRPQLLQQPTWQQLDPEHPLLVITSSTGDGELPARLRPLLHSLQRTEPRLEGLRYALAALGDSSYTSYCGGGHTLARALDNCGAIALAPVLEIDACTCINPEDKALPWALTLIEENA